jgi:hypothetical protein
MDELLDGLFDLGLHDLYGVFNANGDATVRLKAIGRPSGGAASDWHRQQRDRDGTARKGLPH